MGRDDETIDTTVPPDFPPETKGHSLVVAYTLWAVLGVFGAHHLYLGRHSQVRQRVRAVGHVREQLVVLPPMCRRVAACGSVCVCAWSWGVCLWVAVHAVCVFLFARRPRLQAVLYLQTFGFFGVGWIRDMFMLPRYVDEANCTSGMYTRRVVP